jgi:hypothetical protein
MFERVFFAYMLLPAHNKMHVQLTEHESNAFVKSIMGRQVFNITITKYVDYWLNECEKLSGAECKIKCVFKKYHCYGKVGWRAEFVELERANP